MKYIYTAIAVIIIGLLIYVFWPRNEQKDIDVTQLTRTLQDKVERAETLRQNVIVKAKDDSLKHAIINKAKDEEIARLKRRAIKAKTVHVDTVIAQDPEVGNYIMKLDSIVVSQDSQISELKEQKAEQWASFNQLITASDSTAQANKELNDFVNKSLEGDNKRLNRQNLGLKIGIVAIPVGILALVLMK